MPSLGRGLPRDGNPPRTVTRLGGVRTDRCLPMNRAALERENMELRAALESAGREAEATRAILREAPDPTIPIEASSVLPGLEEEADWETEQIPRGYSFCASCSNLTDSPEIHSCTDVFQTTRSDVIRYRVRLRREFRRWGELLVRIAREEVARRAEQDRLGADAVEHHPIQDAVEQALREERRRVAVDERARHRDEVHRNRWRKRQVTVCRHALTRIDEPIEREVDYTWQCASCVDHDERLLFTQEEYEAHEKRCSRNRAVAEATESARDEIVNHLPDDDGGARTEPSWITGLAHAENGSPEIVHCALCWDSDARDLSKLSPTTIMSAMMQLTHVEFRCSAEPKDRLPEVLLHRLTSSLDESEVAMDPIVIDSSEASIIRLFLHARRESEAELIDGLRSICDEVAPNACVEVEHINRDRHMSEKVAALLGR